LGSLSGGIPAHAETSKAPRIMWLWLLQVAPAPPPNQGIADTLEEAKSSAVIAPGGRVVGADPDANVRYDLYRNADFHLHGPGNN
jgi:hypothetical protein